MRPKLTGLDSTELIKMGSIPLEVSQKEGPAIQNIMNQLGPLAEKPLGQTILSHIHGMKQLVASRGNNNEILEFAKSMEGKFIKPANILANRARNLVAAHRALEKGESYLFEENGHDGISTTLAKEMRKAQLDVGTLTNYANVIGGQALGYFSLDTRLARATIRPESMVLYNALDKSLAWQVVDFWTIALDTGGAPAGSAFQNYSNVTSGSLVTSAGIYDMYNVTLKLVSDGRSVTTALGAQNNYVNVAEQETSNAMLTIMESMNWANYWGDSSIFANQFDGIYRTIISQGYQATNLFDYYQFYAQYGSVKGWTSELALYNQIYMVAGQLVLPPTYAKITHAFMDPTVMADFQGITQQQLNNIINEVSELQVTTPIVINGNFLGMQTRFGHIQFPMDLHIDFRNAPLQSPQFTPPKGTNPATTVNPTPPASVTATVITGANAAGSNFTGSYTPTGGGSYMYAAASTNASMLESVLTYSTTVSGVTSGSAVSVVVAPPGANDETAFRVFRSGLGGVLSSGSPQPNEFRWIGNVLANGSSSVTFVDLNGGVNSVVNGGLPTFIPGSSAIFLLDMDPQDLAIDYRLLLPPVRIDLFASNLYMPWAVASIGCVRLRVPKWHAVIRNFVPTNVSWNPLAVN